MCHVNPQLHKVDQLCCMYHYFKPVVKPKAASTSSNVAAETSEAQQLLFKWCYHPQALLLYPPPALPLKLSPLPAGAASSLNFELSATQVSHLLFLPAQPFIVGLDQPWWAIDMKPGTIHKNFYLSKKHCPNQPYGGDISNIQNPILEGPYLLHCDSTWFEIWQTNPAKCVLHASLWTIKKYTIMAFLPYWIWQKEENNSYPVLNSLSS